MRATHILMFDIDGTLVRTEGAGVRALNRVMAEMFGVHEALARINYAGRSDSWIVQELFAAYGITSDRASRDAFRDAYLVELPRSLQETQGMALPGITELLTALADRPAVVGLGTGNFRRGGKIKLGHFGLDEHFVDGGFGDDSHDRPTILSKGLERLRAHAPDASAVVVIGDTVHDVTAGHAIGAKVVGVGTGSGAMADFADAGADLLLDDLSDLNAALDALLG